MFNNFFPENRTVYEMWKNMVEPKKPYTTIWRMRLACWIQGSHTHTHNIQHLLLFHGNNG